MSNALKLLIFSSILLFSSIISLNYKVFAIGFIQWIAVIGYNLYVNIFKYVSVSTLVGTVDNEVAENYKKKNYALSGVYALVLPLIVIGLLCIIATILCMLFVFK